MNHNFTHKTTTFGWFRVKMTHGCLICSTGTFPFLLSVFSLRIGQHLVDLEQTVFRILSRIWTSRPWEKGLPVSILELNLVAVMFIFYFFHSGIEPLFKPCFPRKSDLFDLKWGPDHPVPLYRQNPLLVSLFFLVYVRLLSYPLFSKRESNLKEGGHFKIDYDLSFLSNTILSPKVTLTTSYLWDTKRHCFMRKIQHFTLFDLSPYTYPWIEGPFWNWHFFLTKWTLFEWWNGCFVRENWRCHILEFGSGFLRLWKALWK